MVEKFSNRVRFWTKTAIDCYNRRCICNGCPIKNIMETKCQMKKTVLELVRIYGKPKKKAGQNDTDKAE